MFRASSISFIVIVLATQFHTINAVFDWLGFFERWIFGSNNPSTFTHSRLILEGEQAEKKFVDNEVQKVSRPKILEAQLKQNTIDAHKWIEYHKSSNIFMRYISGWAIDTLWKKKMNLEEELRYAEDDIDLEPFCHNRYHNHNPEETDLLCYKAFQNQFFRNKGWMLDERYSHGTYCSRVTISSLQRNEYNEHRKLVYYREARRCQAYTQHSPEASPSYFGVYLISHETYLTKKQFAYFVFLSSDNVRDTANDNYSENGDRGKRRLKKVIKYLSFWEEKKVQIVAYIEN